MTIASLQKYRRILILGFGSEGKSSEAFLRTHVPHALIDSADMKSDPNYLSRQNQYDLIIKTPGIPKNKVTRPYTTATNIFFANAKGMIIGVTGSKGKSTTASLIYTILKTDGRSVHLVGNIGKPALDVIQAGNNPDAVYVYELSSYQLDDIKYSPHIAVMTNFFPEHMDYHGSVAAYWEAKKKIIAYATESDYLVYHPRYPELTELARSCPAKASPAEIHIPIDDHDIPLIGQHNKENIQLAVTVAKILRIGDETVGRAIRAFIPLPHRLQCIGVYKGITFYDDAISTTPQSTLRALEAFPHVGSILLGGQNRGYDFSELAREIARRKIQVLVLFPDSGDAISDALAAMKYVPRMVLKTSDMASAVKFVYRHAPRDSVCLLSTASPSYSVWKNFEEKGSIFQKYVKIFGEEL
ncbi:UDP-N-acetylmuramoyl-L-alanine--D-glutamate ligase [Candidatus Gottesmanbacteria bacterium]|nr:UDP-N-acetylmuramoyl-L-alanine--D-glutamate ligase [Candidatus Gottesmanbacteria bacterium]